MEASFMLHVYDWGEDYVCSQVLEINEQEVAQLRAMTSEAIIAYLRDHCVGKCNTVPGQELYFIPVMQFGTLKASLQVNYYVWSLRDDLRKSQEPLIEPEEFAAVCKGPDSVLDVAFSLDGHRISCGQMKVREVCEFFNSLADQEGSCYTLDSRP